MEAGLTAGDAEDVLVAVAPIVGAPRTASAAGKIMEALDLAIELGAGRRQVGTGRLSVALGPGTALLNKAVEKVLTVLAGRRLPRLTW